MKLSTHKANKRKYSKLKREKRCIFCGKKINLKAFVSCSSCRKKRKSMRELRSKKN